MATFSISDTAFTGFGVVRHKPLAVLIWFVLQLVISIGFATLMITQFGPLMSQMQAYGAQAKPDPAQALAMMQQLAPFYGVMMLFSLIFYPILFATMNRAVLRPSEDAFAYIRLGADEFRQLGLVLIYFVMFMLAYMGLFIVGLIVGSIIGGLSHQLVLGPLIAIPIVLAGLIGLAVRFSLASAQTFATRKLDLFGTWSLTKGRFWPVFGTYAVATSLFLIVNLLGYVVIFAAAALAGGGHDLIGELMHPQTASASQYFTPARIVQLVLGAALGAITIPILMTPAPAIYRAIVSGASTPVDVF